MLGRIADAQRSAGFIAEAAATFEQALVAVLSSGKVGKANRLVSLIQTIA
jgi:hypothetical protein